MRRNKPNARSHWDQEFEKYNKNIKKDRFIGVIRVINYYSRLKLL